MRIPAADLVPEDEEEPVPAYAAEPESWEAEVREIVRKICRWWRVWGFLVQAMYAVALLVAGLLQGIRGLVIDDWKQSVLGLFLVVVFVFEWNEAYHKAEHSRRGGPDA